MHTIPRCHIRIFHRIPLINKGADLLPVHRITQADTTSPAVPKLSKDRSLYQRRERQLINKMQVRIRPLPHLHYRTRIQKISPFNTRAGPSDLQKCTLYRSAIFGCVTGYRASTNARISSRYTGSLKPMQHPRKPAPLKRAP